jgi:predicted dehydrogenase
MSSSTARPFRWAVLGPGVIARKFVAQLPASRRGVLVAVGSSDPARAASFALEHGLPASAGTGYAEVLADPAVDAVYVATVHTTHARLTCDALAAGKHVLCEKPLAPDLASVRAMVGAARDAGRSLVEAYKFRFHPQTAALLDLVADGRIGQVVHVDAGYSFAVAGPRGRLFDPATAGGAVLDVGGYPLAFARAVAGAAVGEQFAEPEQLRATGVLGSTGVDEWSVAQLTFPDGITASLRTGIRLAGPNTVTVHGSRGFLHLAEPWTHGPDSSLQVGAVGAEPEQLDFRDVHPFALEADALAASVGVGEAPQMSLDDSLGNAAVLDRWRADLGLRYPFEPPPG